jgi:GNAT superfamily N-acetyltransferase
MEITVRDDYQSSWIDAMLDLYNKTELKRSDKRRVDAGFKNSFAVASCWKGDQLIAIGRMISDGEMYSGIFDVVVDPHYHKQGLGKKIMETLIAKAPETVIHLTSTY